MRATGLESSIHYTYRREVYASGQEVFMTQRVARPMKFAAFISIIISVAVMFAACQGAVGTPGDTGPQGPKGDPGDTGDPGQSGTSALTPLPDPPAIMINDSKEDGQTSVGSVPAGLSASSYFRGGKLPLKFAAERVDQDEEANNNEEAETLIAKTFDLKVRRKHWRYHDYEAKQPSCSQDSRCS